MIQLIAIVCFFRFFYYLIGEPLKNFQNDAPLSCYTYYMSKLINYIKGNRTPEIDGLHDTIKYDLEWSNANENLGMYKILFCGFCQSFWSVLIVSLVIAESPIDFLVLFSIPITISLLIFKI